MRCSGPLTSRDSYKVEAYEIIDALKRFDDRAYNWVTFKMDALGRRS
jgi:hypothetical protein